MSVQKEKRDLKEEKIRSPNDTWKGYLNTRGLEPPTAAPRSSKDSNGTPTHNQLVCKQILNHFPFFKYSIKSLF